MAKKVYTLPAKHQGKPYHKTEQACIKCGVVFPYTLEYFALNTASNTNSRVVYLRTDCRACNKKMSDGQKIAKKLAGNPPTPPIGTPCDRCGCTDRKLVFDHCHETLAHRGWLCDNCNRSMGMLGDDIEGQILSAIYIAKSTKVGKSQVLQILEQMWSN